MTRKKQTVKKAGKWDAEIKKKRIIRTGLPAAVWPQFYEGGIVFGRDMVIGKGAQAVDTKTEPRFVFLKSDKHVGIYDRLKGMVDVAPANTFARLLMEDVSTRLNDNPEAAKAITTWEPISKYAEEFSIMAPTIAAIDPHMPKVYKSLTEESGKAATDKIIAALREEFGPDLSIIISLEAKNPDGRKPLVTATDANMNHLKVHLLEMLKLAAKAE